MSSYGGDESSVSRPEPISRRSTRRETPRSSESSGAPETQESMPISTVRQTDSTVIAPQEVDYSMNVIAFVGGGLSGDRIADKLPDEVKHDKLIGIVKYMISNEVVGEDQNKQRIRNDILRRMEQSDYRAIVNKKYNFHNDRLAREEGKDYFERDTQQIENESDGTVTPMEYYKIDIAIVTRKEGGRNRNEIEYKEMEEL